MGFSGKTQGRQDPERTNFDYTSTNDRGDYICYKP